MSSIFTGQKMADTSKDELLLGGGMDSLRQVVLYLRHITATQAEVKEVPACVRNIVLTR